MLTYEQYEWLMRVRDGECDMRHRDEHPQIFIHLKTNELISYGNGKYHITEKGLLELQESCRSWNADFKSTIALWLSGIAIAVALLGTVLGLAF